MLVLTALSRLRRSLAPVACLTILAACGGGGGGGGGNSGGGGNGGGGGVVTPAAPTDVEAARFLTQATFGPTEDQITAVKASGYTAWIDQQLAINSASHLTYMDNRLVQLQATNPNAGLSSNQFYESFWSYSATGDAQLRERMKLALSEIFVISLNDPNVDVRGAASYYDMLGRNAFGNYRTLLEQVSLHPMMGRYLTHLGNQREDLSRGRTPDENYAREILQLMSIGVSRLKADGTPELDGAGVPVPSYTQADISGLAKVFTGFSWYHPTPTNSTFFGGNRDPESYTRPMVFYANYHSTSEKTFLGATIGAGSTDGAADLKTALDAIFNHPNVGPFISRQLIQRFVTSNPSPAYVQRVAAVFNNDGTGERGDLGAVIKAVLLDAEARNMANVSSAGFGKVREPMIRMTNWMRAFKASSTSGAWTLNSTSANTSLGQSALSSPSVFNFYRPGYVPPNTRLATAGYVQPEFQIVDEVSVAGYANTMQGAIGNGVGSSADIKSLYASEVLIADDANALAERVNKLLLYGQMSSGLKNRIVQSVNSVAIPGGTATPAQIDAAKLNRAKLAVYLTMVSPEYIVQR